jgi:hypothetical protein
VHTTSCCESSAGKTSVAVTTVHSLFARRYHGVAPWMLAAWYCCPSVPHAWLRMSRSSLELAFLYQPRRICECSF